MDTTVPVFGNIWLADDDEEDCELFQDVLKQILPLSALTVIANGEDLLEMLRTQKPPDMLFLDIHMPCKSGLDCLVAIRGNEHLKNLPVVAFSGSDYHHHVDQAYRSGAHLYYPKPVFFTELVKGLTKLFSLSWTDPAAVAREHFLNDKFVPFSALPSGKN